MSGPLAGMAALVTGGGGGIGSASALGLARDGAAVTLMGRTEKTLEAAKARLLGELDAGAVVRCVVGDATNAGDVERAVDAAHGLADGLRICVATVGGGNGTTAPLLVLDEQMLLDVYNFNVVSAFLAMKYSTPRMIESGGGSIVCISSVAANATTPYLSSYVAAKAGLEASFGWPRWSWRRSGYASTRFDRATLPLALAARQRSPAVVSWRSSSR
jgi:NAD(P)-dependent dehydrogenase (short-subunit alcohol dehydrogenase family)